MKREEMLQLVGEIVDAACAKALERSKETYVEDASEAIVKVFERSLEESISEATKMFPRGLFKGLFKGVEKK